MLLCAAFCLLCYVCVLCTVLCLCFVYCCLSFGFFAMVLSVFLLNGFNASFGIFEYFFQLKNELQFEISIVVRFPVYYSERRFIIKKRTTNYFISI